MNIKQFLLIFFISIICIKSIYSLTLTKDQQNLLNNINIGYMSYKSIKTEFTQVDSQNNTIKGWFVLQRPKQARIEYYTNNLRLIANGSVFILEDTNLNQKTQLPLNQSIFSYLLEEKNSLINENVEIIDFVEKNETLELTLTLKTTPEIGKLTLNLDKKTGHILAWTVVDSTNNKTSIVLSNTLFSNKGFSNSSIFNTQRIINIKFDSINLPQ
jgi:outer membrane lipoprotein-sorting protein